MQPPPADTEPSLSLAWLQEGEPCGGQGWSSPLHFHLQEHLDSKLKVLKKDLEDYEVFRSMEEKESKELLVSCVWDHEGGRATNHHCITMPSLLLLIKSLMLSGRPQPHQTLITSKGKSHLQIPLTWICTFSFPS